MEQLGPLPSSDAVLNKLKYDGTFDQFRKTCLTAIEAEPSFRSHGEHVEVLSRRYLQDNKCKSDTTKNELRVKLRDYAVSVIGSPELQVGMPLVALVEKALESKAKDLFPKIMDAVESLREVKPSPVATPTAVTAPPDPPPSTSKASRPTTTTTSSSSTQEELDTAASSSGQGSKTSSDFTSLPLPIDIPGLNVAASKKEQVASSTGSTGESKSSGSKVKSKAADGLYREGGKPSSTKGKVAIPSKPSKGKEKDALEDGGAKDKASKRAKADDSGKSKICRSKEVEGTVDEKDKIRTVKPREEDCSEDKEKTRHTARTKKPKEDKATVSKDESAKDRAAKTAKETLKTTDSNAAEKETKRPDPNETKSEAPLEQREPAEVKPEKDEVNPDTALVGGAHKRKASTPMRRRSARLASHSSENKESGEQQKALSDIELSASDMEGEMEAEPTSLTPPSTSLSTEKREPKKRSVNRKRARVMISSSSDEASGQEEEEGEGEGAVGQSSSEDEGTKKKRYKRESKVSRQQKRARDQAESQANQNSTKRVKRGPQKGKQSSSRKKRNNKAASPVLVTRYNRTVRPNPKYIPSEETQSSEESRPCSPVSDEPATNSPHSRAGEAARPTAMTGKGRK